MLIFRQCHVCDSVAAIILAIMIIGTMLPMSVYTGKILLQVSIHRSLFHRIPFHEMVSLFLKFCCLSEVLKIIF